jgi:alpha-D-xyloside xylohydrolase
MLLEFDEIGCEDLDRQYMLGDGILVAPVFREDGVVDYYLPRGKWTHLLTGETVEGNGWRRDTYDFFSLPVFVRENTILPVGSSNLKPEYDYADGLTLRLYQFADGAEAERVVCDTEGNVILTAKAVRNGDTITVKLTGRKENVTLEQFGTDCRIVVE